MAAHPDPTPDEPAPSDSTAADPTGADPDEEAIDEIGEESFPASDSPSTWAGPPTPSH